MVALNGSIPSCGEGALACSCGDCPTAAGCEPPSPPPPPEPSGCPAFGTTRLSCADISLAALYIGLLACLPLLIHQSRQQLAESRERRLQEAEAGGSGGGPLPRSGKSRGGAGSSIDEIETGSVAGASAGGDNGNSGGEEEELIQWPAAEQVLRQWYYRQGLWCARRPLLTLALSLLLVGACALGLTRFRCVGGGLEAMHRMSLFHHQLCN